MKASKTCHAKLHNDVQFLLFFFKSIHNRISLCKSKTAWQQFEGNELACVVGGEEEEHQNTGSYMKDL